MRKKIRDRAWTAFERSVGQIQADFKAMVSDHAAKGLLQSGATIKTAIGIFEERSGQALDATLSEAAKLIEHRGRKWTTAMAGIGDALDEHLGRASDILQAPLRAAGSNGSDAAAARANELIGEVGTRLQGKLADFREGWITVTVHSIPTSRLRAFA